MVDNTNALRAYTGQPKDTKPAYPVSDPGSAPSNAEALRRYKGTRKEDQWERDGWRVSLGPLAEALPILEQSLYDPVHNFVAGAAASANQLASGALLMSTDIGEMVGMSPSTMRNMAASLTNFSKKNLQPYGTDVEAMNHFGVDLSDRVMYQLGHYVPGIFSALLAGKAALPLASINALSRVAVPLFGTNVTAPQIMTMAGRTLGGNLVTILDEYGQAFEEGREPDLIEAVKQDFMFNLAFGTTFEFIRAMNLPPKIAATLAPAIGMSIVGASGAPPEDIIATGIMFALGQMGHIRAAGPNSGPTEQSALRVLNDNVREWIRARQKAGLTTTPKDYIREFYPVDYKRVYEPTGTDAVIAQLDELAGGKLSPWDAYVLELEDAFDLQLAGVTPENLPAQLYATLSEMQETRGVKRSEFVKYWAAFTDSVVKENDKFKEANPDYGTGIGTGIRDYASNSKYLDNVGDLPEREVTLLKELEPDATFFYKDKKGHVAYTMVKHPKTKGMKKKMLKLEDLTLQEAVQLLGKDFLSEPALQGMLGGEATLQNIRMKHMDAVAQKLAKGVRVPKEILKEYKDTLGIRPEVAALYAKAIPLRKTFDPREEPGDVMQEVADRRFEHDKAVELEDKVRGQSLWENIYANLVDSFGFTDTRLRKEGFTDVADAIQLRYGATSKTHLAWNTLDKAIGIKDWSPEYIGKFSDLYDAIVQQADKQRKSARQSPYKTSLSADKLLRLADGILKQADNGEIPGFTGGSKVMLEHFRTVKKLFDDTLDYAHENGLVTDKVYDEIESFAYAPKKRIAAVLGRLRRIGTPDMIDANKNILDRLGKEVNDEGRLLDIPFLIQGHLARVNSAVATNRIALAMGKYADKSHTTNTFSREQEQPDWLPIEYFEDGKRSKVYVEPKTAMMIEQGLLQNAADQIPDAGLRRFVAWASGANLDRLLISSSPVFALTQIMPDFLHIVTSHPEFHPSPAAVGKLSAYTSVYRTGLKYFKGDKANNVSSFASNVKTVKTLGPEYEEFIKVGGSAVTLANNAAIQDLLDRNVRGRTGWETPDQLAKLGGTAKKVSSVAMKNTIRSFQAMAEYSHAMEMGGRLTEYQLLKATGMTPEQAAAAVNARLNYSKAGLWTKQIKSFVPFLVPGITATETTLKFIKHDAEQTGGKRTARIMTQLALGYGAMRAINEQVAPGAERDRTMEDRIYTSLMFIGEKDRDPHTGEVRHYGIRVKDAMNPMAATAKYITLMTQDYYYDKMAGKEPTIYTEAQVSDMVDLIIASTPAELQSYIPNAADVFSIYLGNTKRVAFNAGNVYLGDPTTPEREKNDILTKSQRGYGDVTEPAFEVAGEFIGDANSAIFGEGRGVSFLASPARMQAVVNSYFASSTTTDTVRALPKLFGWTNDEPQSLLHTFAKDVPAINKFLGYTTPNIAMRKQIVHVNKISKRNFDRAIEDKVRPLKIEMLKEMKLPDIRGQKELLNTVGILNKGLQKIHGYNWEGKETLRGEAVKRLTNYHSSIVTYWQMDQTIRKIAKAGNAPMIDAYSVIGPWKVWRNIFDGDKLPEDRGQLLYERWLDLQSVQDDWTMSKSSWTKITTLFNTLTTQAGSLDGDAWIAFDKLRKNFNKRNKR